MNKRCDEQPKDSKTHDRQILETGPPTAWRVGDSYYLAAVVVYSLLNVAVMLLAAQGIFGQFSFEWIIVAFVLSCIGAVLAFPAQIALREKGVTWVSALAALACLLTLTLFNYWCLMWASAEV